MILKFCPASFLYARVRQSVPLTILKSEKERSRTINDNEGDKE
jgi:hypothetical protein